MLALRCPLLPTSLFLGTSSSLTLVSSRTWGWRRPPGPPSAELAAKPREDSESSESRSRKSQVKKSQCPLSMQTWHFPPWVLPNTNTIPLAWPKSLVQQANNMQLGKTHQLIISFHRNQKNHSVPSIEGNHSYKQENQICPSYY